GRRAPGVDGRADRQPAGAGALPQPGGGWCVAVPLPEGQRAAHLDAHPAFLRLSRPSSLARPPRGEPASSTQSARSVTASLAKKLAAPFSTRWDRNYVAAKVKTDPLYGAVYDELRGSDLPLLDLGCGLGLLAFYL